MYCSVSVIILLLLYFFELLRMAMPMEVNRLERDEFIYELKFRGITTKDDTSVDEIRKILRRLLKLERGGTPLTYPTYPFEFGVDHDEVKAKTGEISLLLSTFADREKSGPFMKISTKLWHAYKRIDRSCPKGDGQTGQKSKLIVTLLDQYSSLQRKARKYQERSQTHGAVELAELLSSTNIESSETSSSSESEDDPEEEASVAAISRIAYAPPPMRPKSVPVYQWNLAYDGESMSLNAFLETVSEYSVSRNVTKAQLCVSAADLFKGRAKIWYNSIRNSVVDWDDLVGRLRKQFLPSDYNDRLLEEIKQRTQGPKESIGLYIATIKLMFDRLTFSVSEALKLKIILKNISPFYQSQLGLVQIKSIEELIDVGRQLEERKEAIEAFVPPPRNRKFMEPDLAYVYTDGEALGNPSSCHEINTSCWNCKEPGHRAAQCPKPKGERYCFKCGNPGHTVRSCPKCSRNSGNFSGRP